MISDKSFLYRGKNFYLNNIDTPGCSFLKANPNQGKKFIVRIGNEVSYLPDYSDINQSIKFNLTQGTNLTAVFAQVDYNVSVQIYALDSYGNEISETPGSIFFQGKRPIHPFIVSMMMQIYLPLLILTSDSSLGLMRVIKISIIRPIISSICYQG